MSDLITYRSVDLADEQDRRFVLDGWLKSWRKSQYAGVVANNRFSEVTFDTIKQLFDRGMTILVAESVNPDTKVGFIAYERSEIPVLHYLYVKPVLRGLGFGGRLLTEVGITPEEPFVYTFRTSDSRKLVNGTHCPAIGRRKDLGTVYAENPRKRSKV